MAIIEVVPGGGLATWRPGVLYTGANDIMLALEKQGRDVVVDLTGYTPHDTSDLGALVNGVRQFQAEGGRPVFMCPAPATRVLLQTTGIHRVVPVVSDMASAAHAAKTS